MKDLWGFENLGVWSFISGALTFRGVRDKMHAKITRPGHIYKHIIRSLSDTNTYYYHHSIRIIISD